MNIVKYETKTGWAGIFGLPFFLFGAFFFFAALNPNTHWKGGRPQLFFIVPFCFIFICIGLLIMGGRGGFIVDPRARIIKKFWGIFIPLGSKSFSFDEIEGVISGYDLVKSKNSSYPVYPVSLVLRKDKKWINLERPRDESASEEMAEKIARTLRVDYYRLRSKSKDLGEAERKKPEEIDPSFQVKISQTSPQTPVLPSDSLIKVSSEKNELNLEIPAVGVSFPGAIIFFVPAILFFLFGYFIFPSSKASGFFSSFFVLFFAFPFVLTFFRLMGLFVRRIHITIKKSQLIVKSTYFGIVSSSRTFATDEIDDVKVVSARRDNKPESNNLSRAEIMKARMAESNRSNPIRTGLIRNFSRVQVIANMRNFHLGVLKHEADALFVRDVIMYTLAGGTLYPSSPTIVRL